MKKLEPTTSTFVVEVEKTVRVIARCLVSVKARKLRTKKIIIKNSAQDLDEYLEDNKAYNESFDGMDPKVISITSADDGFCTEYLVDTCPHCNKVVNQFVFDLGEVDD